MRTAAIVVDWRKPNETLAALGSLAGMLSPPDTIVCVENESSADELHVLRAKAPPAVQFIVNSQNVGFAAAVNMGMTTALESEADWVLLLNNDAVVMPSCLERCLEQATAYPDVAAVGPAISFANRPETLWFGGGQASRWFAFTRHRGLMGPASSPPPTSETDWVTGCCMLVSAAAWRSLGPFREDFFAYYEDAEWCQRARAQGWHCRYVGEVLCRHAVSVSGSRRSRLRLSESTAYYMARNPLRFALDTKRLDRRVTRTLGLMVVWNAYHAVQLAQTHKASVAVAYLKGLADGLRGRMGRLQRPGTEA